MTDTQLAWLAGLLEGEGCFCIQKPLRPCIQLEMTDRDVIERAAVLMDSSIGPTRLYKAKPSYRITIKGAKAVQIMISVAPLMGERRQRKIKEILTIWEETLHSRQALRLTHRTKRKERERDIEQTICTCGRPFYRSEVVTDECESCHELRLGMPHPSIRA